MKKALIPFITVLILTNTTTYCQETKPWSTKEKIEALSKFWAEARRNFVYMPQIGVQRWDSLYRENIQIALDSKTDWDFYCQMKRFCGFLQNGHTSIQADGIPWTTTAFRGMELQTMYADGKIIVSGIDSLNSLRIPLGSEIVEIEGEPAIEYMKKNIVPLQAASTPHIQMRWAASSLFHVEVSTIVLTNNFTASAAEDFLIFASQLDNFITMGETTFGSTGQPITMNLCRRMRARICTIECAFYDLSSFEGVGIEPDIAIPVTVKDLLGTKDVQLETAVKEMKRRLKANK